jgi:Ca2+-binding EF-hand superfamily protein
MQALGYWMAQDQAYRLFQMIDTDHGGQIDEREFCAYFASMQPQPQPQPFQQQFYGGPGGYAAPGGYGGYPQPGY